MRSTYKLGLSVSLMLMTAATAASAADVLIGRSVENGYVTASTCGKLSASLAKGTATLSYLYYPGASKTGMALVSPQTPANGAAKSASTNVCIAAGAVPAAGLNGASLTFNCYNDTASGPAAKAEAQLKSKFAVAASHLPGFKQVTVTSSLVVNGTAVCTFTSDGTYSAQ